jgi:protein-tyrosine phosphatase/membrane-associated phospholipid phosphatase
MTTMNTDRVTRWTATKAAVGLSVFFLLVYGATNHYTSLRSDVGTWVYAWERHIPFVPLMIIPYLSIDLLFVAAPFLCRERDELKILSRRIVLAVTLAAACYLVMPLRFSFERPPAPGLLGVVFDGFRSMDKPYNQLPSLHIALRTILAELYARRTRGWTRAASHVWFSLIGASTLLTYQHHVIDVAGGFVLAGVCFYLVSDARWRLSVTRNLRIGGYYAAGAAVLAAIAMVAPPWTTILFWPAAGLAIVAAAYVGVGPAIFRKQNGRLPLRTWLLLGPVIAGQWLSMRYYARKSRRWDVVTPNVWIGRTLTRHESVEARVAGVTAVLDLTAELPDPIPFRAIGKYRNVPILDLTAPTPEQIAEAVAFLGEQVRAGAVVYVHCKAGYSRSAAIVTAYLLHARHAQSTEEALAIVRKCRAGIIVRPEALQAFHSQAQFLYSAPYV